MILNKYNYKQQALHMNTGQIFRFYRELQVGDYAVTYSSQERAYLVGTIASDYIYDSSFEFANQRSVKWLGKVPRDILSISAKNALGSIASIFEIKNPAKGELLDNFNNKDVIVEKPTYEEEDEEREFIKKDVEEKAREFIKDKVISLSWDEMQELVAALLRSLGFKTKVSPKGPDRGKDIIASPDGLGLEEPCIYVEVKHRKGTMGAPEIRNFLGGVRSGKKGLYVSTGGFSREARYEAERANISLTLIDLDEFTDLIISNYDNFDLDGRALIPLRKIYWPA
jgi:restriction system protein